MTSPVAPRYSALTPLTIVSIGAHGAALLTVLVAPHLYLWAILAIVVNHLVLSIGVLLPRSAVLGPNLTRLPNALAASGAIALTFDDGPDPRVTPQVLDILDRFGAKASFFCLGQQIRSHPQLAALIVQRGHSVENHSDRHPHGFSFFGPRRLAAEVDRAQVEIFAATGTPARFFRAPAGFRSPFLHAVLARRGLRYVSWQRRGFDTVAREPQQVIERLTRRLGGGDILLLHDRAYRNAAGGMPMVLSVLPQLLQEIAQRNLRSVSLSEAFPPAAGEG